MTTSTTSTVRDTSALATVAIGVTVATLALDAFGIWGYGSTDDNAAVEMLVTGLLTLAAAGVVFGLVLPRALRKDTAGRTGLVLSILALLVAVPLFWAGVAPILAVGGIVAGRSDRGRMATAAFVVGILALIGCLGTYAGDWLSQAL
jgi:high-affinity Fe2+/Pb2+ permease